MVGKLHDFAVVYKRIHVYVCAYARVPVPGRPGTLSACCLGTNRACACACARVRVNLKERAIQPVKNRARDQSRKTANANVMEYILVGEREGDEPCEIELEDDETLSLSTLASEFGDGVSGLSYTNPETGNRRIIRLDGCILKPPRKGWASSIHLVVRAKATSLSEESFSTPSATGVKNAGVPESPQSVAHAQVKREDLPPGL